jgi:RNA polymerase sigma-70 factor (ECF subfamily)
VTAATISKPDLAESRLVDALRAGDERAFAALVERYNGALLRLARGYCRSRGVAEEVVQETWLGVIEGIDRFECRSSLKTWIFRILTNKAKTRGEREARSIPFSTLAGPEDDEGAAVDPGRFYDSSDPRWPGHWADAPRSWARIPEERLLSKETLACVERAIAELPLAQRTVISLRDVEGWGPNEVCEALGVSEANQRVLLHRARSKVRRAIEAELDEAHNGVRAG